MKKKNWKKIREKKTKIPDILLFTTTKFFDTISITITLVYTILGCTSQVIFLRVPTKFLD